MWCEARVSDDGHRQVVAGATCHHLVGERDDVYLQVAYTQRLQLFEPTPRAVEIFPVLGHSTG